MKYLSNTPLAKNQRLKKYLKTMFDKHAFKDKKIHFTFDKNKVLQTWPYRGGKRARSSHVSWAS
jgi:hypothetical protein